ncbi:MAG: hypothetical protein HN348_04405 [Proteobacteria bacterium]|jgi:hypothetical protein|nr:hypothetical protein [Pseudomonadota bacterium]
MHKITVSTLLLGACSPTSTNRDDTDPNDIANAACNEPNPRRAQLSSEIYEAVDISTDGSFELGTADIELYEHAVETLDLPSIERASDAALSGDWGYWVDAAPGQGGEFLFRANVDKGLDIEFTLSARSKVGISTVKPLVYFEEEKNNGGIPEWGDEVEVGTDWTEITYFASSTSGIHTVLFGLEIGPQSSIHIDDIEVKVPHFKLATYDDELDTTTVGGIEVPLQPVAETNFTFVIHIEDPGALESGEDYFFQQSYIFEQLAQTLHSHDGFLTIQPEEDWVLGAVETGFDPDLLEKLHTDLNVQYSTHTHGPNCVDDDGRPRSASDCKTHDQWDKTMTDDDIVDYVGNLADLIGEAANLTVTDHNGNFDFTSAGRWSEVGIQTWSAYKDKNTQRTYDYLYNNPWRPTEANGLEEVDAFLTHDPSTNIVYVPGIGQAITTHHERIIDQVRPMVSQFIRYADADRVNTFYIVMHIGKFYSRTDAPDYLAYNDDTGKVTPSAEFEAHLQHWDDLLTEVIDPLVDGGYLTWTSVPEMGKAFVEWEAACAQ